jgi:DNA-binding transcriptional LysR family regulator
MRREELGDLVAFLGVAEERSFTRAAARLGTSQSALSHTIRRLETRLGVRLLTRTTRSVAPTEAGQRLLLSLGPKFDDIASELTALGELRQAGRHDPHHRRRARRQRRAGTSACRDRVELSGHQG